jgi:NADH:ubiquinone oxidoreductase subunit B-like Fe-S oxidoreductase
MYSPDNIFTTTIDKAVRWSRTQSMWPVTFGLACCAIEMMAAGSAKYDLARYDCCGKSFTENGSSIKTGI